MFKKCMLSLVCAVSVSLADTEYINEGYCFANNINVNVCKSFSLFGSIFDNLNSIDILKNEGTDNKDIRIKKQFIAFTYNSNELCIIYNKLNAKDKEFLKKIMIDAELIDNDTEFQNMTKDFSDCKALKADFDNALKKF